ncbi:hypothetical protein ACMFMG_010429 [Clarireedia jacksonii]
MAAKTQFDLQAPDEEEFGKVVRPPSKESFTFKSAVNGKLPKNGHYVFGSHNPKSEGHWCSNFWPSPFKDDSGNEWSTAEAYFQASKAALAKDRNSYNKILMAKTPKMAKLLGRQVNIQGLEWDKVSWKYMADAIYFKFKRNPELREKLLATGDKIIVKAQPDHIWGSGLSHKQTIITDIREWEGQNMLGEVLMLYRNYLRLLKSKGLDPATTPECLKKGEIVYPSQRDREDIPETTSVQLAEHDESESQAGPAPPDNSEVPQGQKRKADNSHEIELVRKKQAVEELDVARSRDTEAAEQEQLDRAAQGNWKIREDKREAEAKRVELKAQPSRQSTRPTRAIKMNNQEEAIEDAPQSNRNYRKAADESTMPKTTNLDITINQPQYELASTVPELSISIRLYLGKSRDN